MASEPGLPTSAGSRRSLAPVLRGAGLGLLFGAAIGALTIVGVLFWGEGPGEFSGRGGAQDIPALAFVVEAAATIGGLYGTFVGAVAGVGAVIVVERGRTRRITVAGLALFVGAMTVAWLYSPYIQPDPGFLVLALPYLTVMTLLAGWLAPRLDGRGSDAKLRAQLDDTDRTPSEER